MKKVSYLLLVAAMVLGLTGCGRSGVVTNNNDESRQQTSNVQPSSEQPSSAQSGSEESSGSSVSTPAGSDVYPDEDGFAEGRYGDVMHNVFFSYCVNSAYVCSEYHGYTPAEGNELLVANVTVTNTSRSSIPMFDTDFQVQWGDDADDAYDYPITAYDPEANLVADEQLPDSYDLAVGETVNGVLVYEVPAGNRDFSISYMEWFADDTTGDVFFVFFTASEQ